ncbi:glycosyltransferase [Bacillus sp. AGMB 02131]|uniref:Glycosyltransferase n=1 Tax=Peribacillus faecalis TaxID=2772559 RepID=A0A927CYJ2_9BACI|nr:glycosyltransferase [Peribacillus faecalis]MBD3107684.1 glycosyltransferase [Peribacillus faecalis]
MKSVLIASFDMEIGGVERSLISLLNNFDYANYTVDLMLYKHQGDFMNLLSDKITLLEEITQYTTFRKSIAEVLKTKQYPIAISRVISKIMADIKGRVNKIAEPGYYQMQLMWKFALPILPDLNKEYDVAISYLWPHYFVAEKVKAKKKIAWIHTDYSAIEVDEKSDVKIWNKFDFIIAVSEASKQSFLKKYGELEKKVVVIENLTSPNLIKNLATEKIDNPMFLDTRFKIITVARLSHAKGIDQAIKALKILKDRGFNNIAWYILGYGGEESILKELVKQYNLENNFIFLGKHINPYPFMLNADLYIQPSRYEGKAVTVIEAQILNKPVVITDYSTANSQINDGYDGVICNMSPEGIANEIEKLYQDLNLRKKLEFNCKKSNYANYNQLQLLYRLFSDNNDKKEAAGL